MENCRATAKTKLINGMEMVSFSNEHNEETHRLYAEIQRKKEDEKKEKEEKMRALISTLDINDDQQIDDALQTVAPWYNPYSLRMNFVALCSIFR